MRHAMAPARDGADRAGRSEEPTRRLLFALWPDESIRAALGRASHEAVQASGGRPVPSSNFHVTLAFLGSVPERLIPELALIARSVVAVEFATRSARNTGRSILQLTFDRIEFWRKPKLLCALAREASETRSTSAPSELAELLKERLSSAGFRPDLKPFRAHVTLARKVPHGSREQPMHSVTASFTSFALIDSRTTPEGSVYSVVESWPLVKRNALAP